MKRFLEIIARCIDLYDFSISINEKLSFIVEDLCHYNKFKYFGIFEFEQFSSDKFKKLVEKGEKSIELDRNILTKILISGEYVKKNNIHFFPIKDVFYIYGVLIIIPEKNLNEDEVKFFSILTRFLSLFFKKEKVDLLVREKIDELSKKQKKQEIDDYGFFNHIISAKEFILKLFSVKSRNRILKIFFVFLAYEFKIKKGIFYLKKNYFMPIYGFDVDEFNFISLSDGLKNYDKFLFNKSDFVKKIKRLKKIKSSDIKNPYCIIELKNLMMELKFENLAVFPVFLKDKILGLLVTDKVLKNSHYFKILLLCEILGASLYFSRKINELKETYEKLNKFENVSLLELLGEIAHEIKNPIVSIAGFSNRLKKNFKNLQKSKIEKYVEIINEEAVRLEKLLNDILIFSKSNKISLNPLRLIEVLKECILILKDEIKKRDIDVLFEYTNEGAIIGNKNLLKQVFLNLLQNSIEAINRKGKIFINLKKRGIYCVVSIEDTGGGIPEDIINKIFEPFFTTKEFGTGLGLSISFRIIQQHGGNISVSNTKNGAKFTITLPCRG